MRLRFLFFEKISQQTSLNVFLYVHFWDIVHADICPVNNVVACLQAHTEIIVDQGQNGFRMQENGNKVTKKLHALVFL